MTVSAVEVLPGSIRPSPAPARSRSPPRSGRRTWLSSRSSRTARRARRRSPGSGRPGRRSWMARAPTITSSGPQPASRAPAPSPSTPATSRAISWCGCCAVASTPRSSRSVRQDRRHLRCEHPHADTGHRRRAGRDVRGRGGRGLWGDQLPHANSLPASGWTNDPNGTVATTRFVHQTLTAATTVRIIASSSSISSWALLAGVFHDGDTGSAAPPGVESAVTVVAAGQQASTTPVVIPLDNMTPDEVIVIVQIVAQNVSAPTTVMGRSAEWSTRVLSVGYGQTRVHRSTGHSGSGNITITPSLASDVIWVVYRIAGLTYPGARAVSNSSWLTVDGVAGGQAQTAAGTSEAPAALSVGPGQVCIFFGHGQYEALQGATRSPASGWITDYVSTGSYRLLAAHMIATAADSAVNSIKSDLMASALGTTLLRLGNIDEAGGGSVDAGWWGILLA